MRMRSFLRYLFTIFFTIYEKSGPAKTGPAGPVPTPLQGDLIGVHFNGLLAYLSTYNSFSAIPQVITKG